MVPQEVGPEYQGPRLSGGQELCRLFATPARDGPQLSQEAFPRLTLATEPGVQEGASRPQTTTDPGPQTQVEIAQGHGLDRGLGQAPGSNSGNQLRIVGVSPKEPGHTGASQGSPEDTGAEASSPGRITEGRGGGERAVKAP
eukprot:6949702-Heterocapsa_arctica.AAC.1